MGIYVWTTLTSSLSWWSFPPSEGVRRSTHKETHKTITDSGQYSERKKQIKHREGGARGMYFKKKKRVVRKVLCDIRKMIRQDLKGARDPVTALEGWHHPMQRKQLVQRHWGKKELSSSKNLKQGLCGLSMMIKGPQGLDVVVCSTSL